MKTKNAQVQIIAVVVIVLVLGFVFFVRNSTPDNVVVSGEDNLPVDADSIDSNSNVDSNTNNSINEPSDSGSSLITEPILSEHNSKEDCWIVYNKKVYDMTSYIPRHPGGEDKIAQNCGTLNFESEFIKKHGTSKVELLMKVGTFIGDFDIVGDLE